MNEPHLQPDDCRAALAERLRLDLFRALCDSNRLTLVARLASANRALTVTEAATCCGVHLSGVSRHLSMLRDAGVVRATKQGREVRYEIDCAGLAATLREMADALETCHAVCSAQTQENGNERCGRGCESIEAE